MDNALEEKINALLVEFEPMLTDWLNGSHVTKICYGLNNSHMKCLLDLNSHMEKQNVQ